MVLQPLLMLALYTFVFGILFGARFNVVENESPWAFPLGVFIGITLYGMIAESFGSAPQIILQQRNLVKKSIFPLEVLPAANVLASLPNLGVNFLLFFAGALASGHIPSWHACFLPILVLGMILLALGLAWTLAALGVYFRDIQHLAAFFSTALFYASGVFFSAARVQEHAPGVLQILRFNPVFQAIELSRKMLLWDSPWTAESTFGLLYVFAFGLAAAILGHTLFRTLKPGFADVL